MRARQIDDPYTMYMYHESENDILVRPRRVSERLLPRMRENHTLMAPEFEFFF